MVRSVAISLLLSTSCWGFIVLGALGFAASYTVFCMIRHVHDDMMSLCTFAIVV